MAVCPQCHTGYPADVATCPLDGTSLTGEQDLVPPAVPEPRGEEVTDPLVGATLAERYRITRRIGNGGMGAVYEAVHAVIGKTVAVKVLHERLVERREVAARLMNEARLASSIRNEHIVDIFDFGETADGRTFIVMELLEGESLAAVIHREGAMPEKRAAAVCLQVADALGAAHERGVIHRDVKPENIFLSQRDGVDFVKVLDFGVSKTVRAGDGDEALRLTHTGMVLGTPLYMSPEQARGEEQIDHRIDVYALGVILYECLTGETPFRGTNYLGIISDVLSRTPSPPRQLRPDLRISTSLEQVTARAMARDREVRYPSMAALGADLRHVLAGEAPAVIAPSPASVARARLKRRLLYVAVAAISITVVVTTAMLTGSASGGGPASPSPTAAKAAALAPPAPPPPALVAPPPASVIVEMDSEPPGAEIFDGARKLGVGGQKIELPRSDKPIELRFHLEGYEDRTYNLVPRLDGDRVLIKLAAPLAPPPSSLAKSRHGHTHGGSHKSAPPSDLPAASPYKRPR